jgi:hypothetical protein
LLTLKIFYINNTSFISSHCFYFLSYSFLGLEELDCTAVSALSVRSRKLSNVLKR